MSDTVYEQTLSIFLNYLVLSDILAFAKKNNNYIFQI